MKNILIIVFISCFLTNCVNTRVSPMQSNYKGGKLYEHPPISVFPKEGIYSYTNLSDTTLTNGLNSKMKQILSSQKIIGLTVIVLIPNKGLWQYDTGYASKNNNIPINSNSIFYWASVGKMITSIIIHQLIIENKISLEDKLQKWYPQFQHADKITIKQLLNHTNGIYSFNSDSTFHYSNKYHTPDQLLAIALKRRNLFKPGEYWSYSNTGYLLLGLIAEKIEANNFSAIIKQRLSTPYNLHSLKALSPREIPVNLALSHKNGVDLESHFSTPLGAGTIVSNSKDMAILLSLLLTGKILPVETMHNMFSELYPMFENTGQYYGLGVMLYNSNEINGITSNWIGHSGGTENYKAILAYDSKTQTIVGVSANTNLAVEAIANSIFSFIK